MGPHAGHRQALADAAFMQAGEARRIVVAAVTDDLVFAQLWDQHASAIVVTPREFDVPADKLPDNVTYVGPIFEPPGEYAGSVPGTLRSAGVELGAAATVQSSPADA